MRFWQRNKQYPSFYQLYLEKINDEGFSNDFIALDLETNGLKASRSDVLSVGCIHVNDHKIEMSSEFYQLFNSNAHDYELSKIHELLPVNQVESWEESLPILLQKISNRTILGHFIQLDLSFINFSLKKMGLPKLKNPVKDTLKMALKKDRVSNYEGVDRSQYSLYSLCKRHGIEVNTTHNALEDAYLTAVLYLHLKIS